MTIMSMISEVRLESIEATHTHVTHICEALKLLQEAEASNTHPLVQKNLAFRVSESLRQLDLTLVKLRKAIAYIEAQPS